MDSKDIRYVKRLIYYCNRLEEHVEFFGDDKDVFLSNTHYQDACALVFIQIGEFVGRLSDEFKAEYCEMPWQSIKVMRNKNAHNYDYILFDLVWDTIQEDIPELKQYLEKILKDNQS